MTGLPGTGKTTCGALLAERLGFRFFDTDRIIENCEKTSVREIFAKRGEEHFRALEKEVLRLLEVSITNKASATDPATDSGETCPDARSQQTLSSGLALLVQSQVETAGTEQGLVIAAGGGMPEPAANRKVLQNLGTVVYLSSHPDEIALRLKDDGDRPLLTNEAKSQQSEPKTELVLRLTSLLDRRKQAYESAHITIETAGLTPDQIVNRLQEALKTHHKIL